MKEIGRSRLCKQKNIDTPSGTGWMGILNIAGRKAVAIAEVAYNYDVPAGLYLELRTRRSGVSTKLEFVLTECEASGQNGNPHLISSMGPGLEICAWLQKEKNGKKWIEIVVIDERSSAEVKLENKRKRLSLKAPKDQGGQRI